MTKRCIILGILSFFLLAVPYNAFAEPGVSAQACIVIEQTSGRVLYQKNSQAELPMASTTKIMTALVALEEGNPNDTIKVSSSAASVEGSSMYLEAGETMTLKELLYGLMLSSGNDAAVAIAEYFGGIDAFVTMMNQKAKELGATHTQFANPNGLPNENHYSTAEDMARITAHALNNPAFSEIVATKTYRIEGEGKSYPRVLSNHNKLLRMYEGCIGVKTGFTKAAGRCLVSAAKRNEMTLICVTLNAPDDWNDHQTLYNHCFETYQMRQILDRANILGEISITGSDVLSLPYGANESVFYPLRADEDISISLDSAAELKAPIAYGDACGTISIRLGNSILQTVPLVVQGEAERQWIPESVKRSLRLNLGSIYWRWLTLFQF